MRPRAGQPLDGGLGRASGAAASGGPRLGRPRLRHRGRRLVAGTAATALVTLGVVAFAPVPATAACTTGVRPQPLPSVGGQPWAQQRWGLDRLAALGVDGSGVTVAVIDSGVDVRHPQLQGRVTNGWDAFPPGNGQEDCVGHGTAVASLIAAQSIRGTPFRGLAPGATILPIRASEKTEGNESGRGTPADLAKAIDQAVQLGAQVINLSLVLAEDRTDVREAIARALAKNVVVVAAAGNGHDPRRSKDPTTYPAAYQGVIAVGAIDETGGRYERSQTGEYVSIVAPGNQIQTAAPGSGYQLLAGTSMAAPFVSATAALVIQRFGKNLTAAQVAARLMATADPAPGRPGSPEYGQGVVNPYRAVTEVLTTGAPAKPPPLPQIRPDPAAEAVAEAAARRRAVAITLAGGVGGLALLVVLVAIVVPQGRRRGWRPGT